MRSLQSLRSLRCRPAAERQVDRGAVRTRHRVGRSHRREVRIRAGRSHRAEVRQVENPSHPDHHRREERPSRHRAEVHRGDRNHRDHRHREEVHRGDRNHRHRAAVHREADPNHRHLAEVRLVGRSHRRHRAVRTLPVDSRHPACAPTRGYLCCSLLRDCQGNG